jgi:hypothetical protein
MCAWVFDIFNTITAQYRAPMRFGIGIILIQNTFICGQSLVKLIQSPEVVAPVE